MKDKREDPLSKGLFFAIGLVTLCLALPCRYAHKKNRLSLPTWGDLVGTSSLKVDAGLVVVNATVTDPDHRLITGMDRENFKISKIRLSRRSPLQQ